jgi:sigma-54 specific flagellar transcriptional regulator A
LGLRGIDLIGLKPFEIGMRVGDTVFLGNSEVMVQLRRLIDTCAKSEASVLILGDTGVGKELISRELHVKSSRSNGPLVPINCAAIPGALLESELFGFSKGSFTGAISDRVGRFALANGGTLFLDEIGDMPLELQSKLLRVLEQRVIEPIGGGEGKPIDVRIIAATHRDLPAMVKDGLFRQDLYFRLNVLPVTVPSVRQRKEDILPMCQFFSRIHARYSRSISFTERSADVLIAYDWPGNVREISNLMMRFSVLFAGEKIDLPSLSPELLPEGLAELIAVRLADNQNSDSCRDWLDDHSVEPSVADPQNCDEEAAVAGEDVSPHDIEHVLRLSNSIGNFPVEGIKAKEFMADIEIRLIKAALVQSKGSISRAAQLLHMQRTTLIQKIARYNINTAFL